MSHHSIITTRLWTESSPHSSLMCIGKHHSMARIDGSNRSSGLPLQRLRPAWAASAVLARRVERLLCSALRRPPLGCSVDNSRARRRMLSRAARRLCRSNAVVAPRTLMQKLMSSAGTSRRIDTAAAAQKRYVNNSRCAPRYAGCRARCPGPSKNCFPTWAKRVAYAPHARPLTAATHR